MTMMMMMMMMMTTTTTMIKGEKKKRMSIHYCYPKPNSSRKHEQPNDIPFHVTYRSLFRSWSQDQVWGVPGRMCHTWENVTWVKLQLMYPKRPISKVERLRRY
jgi:hypothetical protein